MPARPGTFVVAALILASACHAPARPPATAPAPATPARQVTAGPQLVPGFTPQTRANERRLAELALRTAAGAAIRPIPLDLLAEGPRHGVVYMPFDLASLAVRDARTRGRVAESQPLGGSVADLPQKIVVAAFPVNCGAVVSRPAGIRLSGSVGSGAEQTARAELPTRDAAAIRRMLPGESLPAGSLVGEFRPIAVADEWIDIDYAAPLCPGTTRTQTFRLVRTPGMVVPPNFVIRTAMPATLRGLPPATVSVMAVVDVDGHVLRPTMIDGPVELASFAEELVAAVSPEIDRINGVAVPGLLSRQVSFAESSEAPVTRAPSNLVNDMRARWLRFTLEIAKEGPIMPVPLDPDGSTTHGFAYEHEQFAELNARRMLARGAFDPASLPPAGFPRSVVIVAAPLKCGDRTVQPTDITMTFGLTPSPVEPPMRPPPGRKISGRDFNADFPEAQAPDGALVAMFDGLSLDRSIVTITYADAPCGPTATTGNTLTFRMESVPPRNSVRTLRFPDGVTDLPSPTRVMMRTIIDATGRVHEVTGTGPASLVAAATQFIVASRSEPRRLNGVGIPTDLGIMVPFTATGEPVSTLPMRNEGITTGARNVTPPTSPCAVASDPAYGVTLDTPIAVGGDDWRGVLRERTYLSALRGPAGQAVTFRFLGAQLSAVNKSYIDVYQVQHAGLAAPIRLYVDEYHERPLFAPAGFTCAGPLRTPGSVAGGR